MRHTTLPVRPVLLLWLTVSIILLWSGWTQVVTLSGWDPDDQLRLVQLRDFLNGQSWFDTTQYRMNAPEGAPMHWSRLIELPLAIGVLLLSPLFGRSVAEMISGAAMPLILLGGVAYILGQIAARLGNREAGSIAALLALISPPVLMQLRPMRIDHHGWQIFLAVLALWTMLWPDKKRGGLTLGFAMAVWLHISLEGAPLTAAFFLLLGWRWVIEKAHGQRLLWTIASFSVTSAALFFGTQRDVLTVYCDSVSAPHLAAIILAAAVMLPSIITKPEQRRWRLAAALAAGGAALTSVLLIAPQCRGGAFGTLDPLVREYWYQHINEGLPVWHQNWRTALVLLATSLSGVAALFAVQSKSAGSASKELRLAGYFLIYSALLSLLVFRTVAVAAAFSIPLIALWIGNLFQSYRCSRVPARRIGLVVLMLFLLIPGSVIGQIYSTANSLGRQKSAAKAAAKQAANTLCQSPASVSALAVLPNARFVAPFDMGPMILMTTPHQVLASSHHRNAQGMRNQIEIFRSKPDVARSILVKRGITHIVACADEAELDYYASRDPQGLWARLAKNQVPGWLEAMPDMGEGIKVWRAR